MPSNLHMLKHACFSDDAGPQLTSGILVQEVQGVFLTARIAVLPQTSPDFYDVRSPCVALYSEVHATKWSMDFTIAD